MIKQHPPDPKDLRVCVCMHMCVFVCARIRIGVTWEVDTAVTGLHMLICCTCGSGIGGLGWSEWPPTHFHPIPFIPTECGSPFMLLSQRREGRREEEKEGPWSQRERGGLSPFPGSERRKNNWCANGFLSLFLDDSPPFFSSSFSLSLVSVVPGGLEREEQ